MTVFTFIFFVDNCSGMLVQDPSKKNDVEALFNQARQAGAEDGPIDHLQPSSSSRSFSGRARLHSGETVASSSVPQEPVTHTITFWTNGFTIDDGPLRRLDDPENVSFLEVGSLTSDLSMVMHCGWRTNRCDSAPIHPSIHIFGTLILNHCSKRV